MSEVTGHPEIMDGRVKTLHPAIHGPLLARRDMDGDLAAQCRKYKALLADCGADPSPHSPQSADRHEARAITDHADVEPEDVPLPGQ